MAHVVSAKRWSSYEAAVDMGQIDAADVVVAVVVDLYYDGFVEDGAVLRDDFCFCYLN